MRACALRPLFIHSSPAPRCSPKSGRPRRSPRPLVTTRALQNISAGIQRPSYPTSIPPGPGEAGRSGDPAAHPVRTLYSPHSVALQEPAATRVPPRAASHALWAPRHKRIWHGLPPVIRTPQPEADGCGRRICRALPVSSPSCPPARSFTTGTLFPLASFLSKPEF